MEAPIHSAVSPVCLADVLNTAELARRPARPADFEAENRGLAALAQTLAADPDHLLQRLAETILEACRADSAGISILEPGGRDSGVFGSAAFRWHAIAGAFAPNTNATIGRDASPCGTVLDQDTVLLFDRPGRYFTVLDQAEPPIVEGLLVPFHVDGRPVGTVWALSHTDGRRFDAEDARVLDRLSRFACAAWQRHENARELAAANAALRREADQRRRADDALQGSERRVRQMLDALPVAVYTTDPEGRLTHVNPQAVEFAGRTPELGTERWCMAWKLRHLDGSPMRHDECSMAIALQEGRAVRGAEGIAERPDGSRVPFEAYPTPLRDADGCITGAVNVAIDTSERQRAEAKLRETKEDLTDFVENATIAMHWVGADGTILWANRAELEMLGLTSEEYIGRHITEFHADAVAIEDILHRMTSAETLYEHPSRLRHKDGSIRDVVISSNVLWRDGEFIHTRCFTRDITEKKKGAEARARLAAVVEFSDDAIMAQDPDGLITNWNRGAERLLGYTAEETIGQPITLLIPSDRLEEEWDTRARIARGEHVDHYETVRRCKDGTLRDVSLTASPIVDTQGRITGTSKVARDITTRKQSERLLMEQSRLLERIAADVPLDDCLSALCAAVPGLGTNARAAVFLADDERRSFPRSIGPHMPPEFGHALKDAPITEPALGTCAEAVCQNKPTTCTDLANDETWCRRWRELCAACDVLACHSQPVLGEEGPVASFTLFFDRARPPSEWEHRLARFGAHIASIALARDRSDRALRESKDRFATELATTEQLQEISTSLIQEGDIDALYQRVLDAATAIMHSDFASIQALDTGRGDLELLAHRGFSQEAAEFWAWVRPAAGSTCGVALDTGRRTIASDVETCEFMTGTPDRETYLQAGIHAVQTTPLVSRDGRMLGMISTHWRTRHEPSEHNLRLLDVLARQAADLIERVQSEGGLRESEQNLRELSQFMEQRVIERTVQLEDQSRRLRHLAAELTTAEQRERKQLAAILHDDLQQLLVAIRMQLARGRARVADEAAAEAIGQAEQLLDESVAKARNLTRQLRPPVLYEDGVVPALRALATDMEERYNLRVAIDAADEELASGHDSIDHDSRALLYESARELLFNVAKYAGVDEAHVEIGKADNEVRLTVRDGGSGFDAGAMFDGAHHAEGFGLFSIRERLAALGGAMIIDAAAGVGTRIELMVPAPPPDHDASRPRNEVREDASDRDRTDGEHRTVRVLVVDDHAIVREGIATLLAMDERLIVVGQAGDGVEAIEMMSHAQPDVVLMDVNMPRMNGIATTREIRRRWPGTAIVGLSVQSDNPTAQSMRDAGAAAFLPKSGDSEQMIATILDVIRPGPGGPATAGH